MERSKIVAVITGAIAIILAIAYLVIVQLLDFRGEILPAPQESAGGSFGGFLELAQVQLLQPLMIVADRYSSC
ncbi:MAG: hypothetical protein JO235_11685 [Chroococcidiopsidaceae cyanobacterium CP_BM_RX_35]|nr:hypothetical protein [Chroococcidiopsidaceae cyanobacterium CP_BM_RX_35]